jgi:hypothetical protein
LDQEVVQHTERLAAGPQAQLMCLATYKAVWCCLLVRAAEDRLVAFVPLWQDSTLQHLLQGTVGKVCLSE